MPVMLDQFRQKIRAGHATTSCHWTDRDTAKQTDGPCTCPTKPTCPEHKGSDCTSTDQVLSQKTNPESIYSNSLEKFSAELMPVNDAIRSGDDLIAQNIKTSDDMFTRVLSGHEPALINAYKSIAAIPVAVSTPAFTKGAKDLNCQCLINKQKRLTLLKQILPNLLKDSNALEKQLGIDLNDLSKVDWVEVALMAVKGAEVAIMVTGEFPLSLPLSVTAGVLKKVLDHDSEGARVYSFAQSLLMLANLKASVILYDIYYEQQRMSLTCQVNPPED